MEPWIFGVMILWAFGMMTFGIYNLSKGASVVTYVCGLPQEKSGSLILLELNDDSVRVKNIKYKTEGTIPFTQIKKSEVIHHQKIAEKQLVVNTAVVDDLVGVTMSNNGIKGVSEDYYFLSIDYVDKGGSPETALFIPDERMSLDKYAGLAQIKNFSGKLNAKIGDVNSYET